MIKSTGMTSCKVQNDRTYMLSIDIVICSFRITKTITLEPSTAIINQSSVGEFYPHEIYSIKSCDLV